METNQSRRPSVTPTGVERYFDAHEVIVSDTDVKGHITFANDVFERVAAYPKEYLLGRPHNLVRHPAMPQCVFRLLWETIAGGGDIRAYVVNLASDGAHYWVLAHVYPLWAPDGTIAGYRSERRAPNRTAVHTVTDLYATLLRTERAAGGGNAGMEASTAQLVSVLQGQGMSYEQFVSSLA
jgi:PAS domain S-box-containing protein